MARTLVIEGCTLDACRAKAVQFLAAPVDGIALQVIQKGRRGIFSSRPYRVRASLKDGNPSARAETSSPLMFKLNTHVTIALAEMERLDALREGEEGQIFNEMVASYGSLPEPRRKEMLEISRLLSGPAARRIQEHVAKDGRFELHISKDRLRAFISVSPPGGIGRPVAMREVLERMQEVGITQGVDHANLRKLLTEVAELGQPLKNIQIAKGKPAKAGRDGRVEYLADPSSRETVVRTDGSMDHRGRARITMVEAGQVLARLVAHTEGVPGVTVYGEEIKPEPGRPAQLGAGENVSFDPESGEYRTAVDGLLETSDGMIHVRQAFVVPSDVDMTTGNIEFDGSVRILGSVRDGFSVRATEDIEIQGTVEGCEIAAETGSVRIGQGVAGRNRCFISAGRDVEAKYIENARVYARHDVTVEVAIMHSEIVAGNSVVALKGKGAIIGGTTKAGNLVQVLILGAPNEPPTEALVGISIEEQDRIRQMDQRLVGLQNAALHLEKVAKEFDHAAKNINSLPPAEKRQYVALRKKLVVLHYEIDKAEARRKSFMEKVTAEAKGMVKVVSEVYGRVVVKIGQFVDRVETSLHGICFRADLNQGRIIRVR